MIPQNPSLVHLIIVLMEKQGSNVIAADYEVSRERKQTHLWRAYTMHDVYTCNSWRLRVVSIECCLGHNGEQRGRQDQLGGGGGGGGGGGDDVMTFQFQERKKIK